MALRAPPDQGRLAFVVDNKIVAGVEKFDLQDVHWRTFSREFTVAVSNLGMDELMALCHESGTAEEDLVSTRLDEPVKLLAKGLYILLNDRISGGKAKDIMEAIPMNEGFVA